MAYTQDLKSCDRKVVRVRLPFPAQKETLGGGAGRARPRGQRMKASWREKIEAAAKTKEVKENAKFLKNKTQIPRWWAQNDEVLSNEGIKKLHLFLSSI